MQRVSRIAVLGICLAQPALRVDADQEPAPACNVAEYRQFDFWVGRWQVRRPDGSVAGINVVTREHGGCVIRESWTGARGMTGTSVNAYNAVTKRWHQSWVDSTGTLLLLDGEFRNGAMTLTGEMFAPGGRQMTRITWTAADRIRQVWEVSKDNGTSWDTIFDGTYEGLRDK